jgi:hypothetical protein
LFDADDDVQAFAHIPISLPKDFLSFGSWWYKNPEEGSRDVGGS